MVMEHRNGQWWFIGIVTCQTPSAEVAMVPSFHGHGCCGLVPFGLLLLRLSTRVQLAEF